VTARSLAAVAVALSLAAAAAPARAQGFMGQRAEAPPPPPPTKDVGFDQKLGEQVPLDLTFTDQEGRTVKLADTFGRKPVILNLVYFECPMLCGMAIEGLLRSLRALSFDAGKEFDVLTVSFDPREGPGLAKAKRQNVLAQYGRPSAEKGWQFLTGDEASIKALTSAVGFRYVWDPAQKQFAHATGIVLLTPQGKVSRYFFGIEYPTKDLRLGLMDSTSEKIGNLADKILLLCYHYDPKSGRYTAAITKILKGGAALTLLGLVGFIAVMLRRERRGDGGDTRRAA
jgi:protein SCO1/2